MPEMPSEINRKPDRIVTWAEFKQVWRQMWQQGIQVTFLETIDQMTRIISGAPTRRFSQITPTLFLGGQYWRHGWPKLMKRGVTAVINMRAEFKDRKPGLSPERYLHLPTVDNTAPTLDQLRRGTQFIEFEITRGGVVYVHCWEGVGRAPTMVAAYLVSTGLTPDEAWNTIRAVRPFIRPNEGQKAQVQRFYAEILSAWQK